MLWPGRGALTGRLRAAGWPGAWLIARVEMIKVAGVLCLSAVGEVVAQA